MPIPEGLSYEQAAGIPEVIQLQLLRLSSTCPDLKDLTKTLTAGTREARSQYPQLIIHLLMPNRGAIWATGWEPQDRET